MPRSSFKPAPPPGLDKTSQALWRELVTALRAEGTFREHDSTSLERYVRAVEVSRLARERIAERTKAGGDGYSTTGSTGQLVQHPDVKLAQDSDRLAATYADALLLSARSRAQHSIAEATDEADSLLDKDLDRTLRLLEGGR